MILKIDLNGSNGIDFRKEVHDHVEDNWDMMESKFKKSRTQTTEAKKLEVKKGFLSQYVVRRHVGLEGIDAGDMDYSSDLTNPNGIKIDVKMEGIKIDFKEEYDGSGGIMRQAKHNFYPRQLFDPNLATTDLFLVTRLRTGRHVSRLWTEIGEEVESLDMRVGVQKTRKAGRRSDTTRRNNGARPEIL